MAIPGSVVAAGKLVTPGGAQGPTGPNAVSTDAGNLATLGSDGLVLVPQSTIWNQRLRSFNAIGDPNFNVDQANVMAGYTNLGNGARIVDRWFWGKGGTHTVNSSPDGGFVTVPGTNYLLSNRALTITLGTAQATLAAGDYGYIFQVIEGTQLRPLFNDVHSVSILIKSSVANLKFSLSLTDPTSAHSFTKLCTIPSANTWTLITIPNIPAFPPAGSWSIAPGGIGLYLGICFGAGANWTAVADGVWSNSGSLASPGTSNWFSNTVGATVTLAFIQHEPGPLCTTFIDKPFDQNLHECLRYFQKTYQYAVKPGAVDYNGSLYYSQLPGQHCYGAMPFKRTMAKAPTTIAGYSPATGAAGAVRDTAAALDRAIAGIIAYGDSGFSGFALSTQNAAQTIYTLQYTADTGL